MAVSAWRYACFSNTLEAMVQSNWCRRYYTRICKTYMQKIYCILCSYRQPYPTSFVSIKRHRLCSNGTDARISKASNRRFVTIYTANLHMYTTLLGAAYRYYPKIRTVISPTLIRIPIHPTTSDSPPACFPLHSSSPRALPHSPL